MRPLLVHLVHVFDEAMRADVLWLMRVVLSVEPLRTPSTLLSPALCVSSATLPGLNGILAALARGDPTKPGATAAADATHPIAGNGPSRDHVTTWRSSLCSVRSLVCQYAQTTLRTAIRPAFPIPIYLHNAPIVLLCVRIIHPHYARRRVHGARAAREPRVCSLAWSSPASRWVVCVLDRAASKQFVHFPLFTVACYMEPQNLACRKKRIYGYQNERAWRFLWIKIHLLWRSHKKKL